MSKKRTFGIVLGLVGTAFDFYSGYFLVSQSIMTTVSMGMVSTSMNVPELVWGVAMLLVGVMLLMVTILGLIGFKALTMRNIGLAMIFFGTSMLVFGASMYSGVIPSMQNPVLSSMGMFVIGILMLVNGADMRRVHRSAMG